MFETGQVKCWGGNQYGKLGLGDSLSRGDGPGEMGDALPFVDLGAGHHAIGLTVGASHTCVLLDDSSIKCWGANGHGQLGYGDRLARGGEATHMGDDLPSVSLGQSVVSVTAGGDHTCALLADRTVRCWGDNVHGELGLGDTLDRGDDSGEMGTNFPAVDVGFWSWSGRATAPRCRELRRARL